MFLFSFLWLHYLKKKLLAGLDSTQTDGVEALATVEDITHQLKQAGVIQTPITITVRPRVVTILNKVAGHQYVLLYVFFSHRTG